MINSFIRKNKVNSSASRTCSSGVSYYIVVLIFDDDGYDVYQIYDNWFKDYYSYFICMYITYIGLPQWVDKGVTTQLAESYLHPPSSPLRLQTASIPTEQLTKIVFLTSGQPF